jgi:PAS domain S-box-containing protein/putative nucleotidyltransferase with HDIG domain
MWLYEPGSTRFLAVNDAAIEHYGYSRDEFAAMTLRDIRPPSEWQRLENVLGSPRAALETSGPWIHQLRDGRRIEVESRSCLVSFRGKPARLVVAMDITDRLSAEARLRQAEENYRSIFENATEEIIQTTPGGRYLTANPAAARMLGFDSPEELIATHDDLDRGFYVKPGRRAEFLRLMEQHGEVSGFESEVFRKDGSTVWISESSKAIPDHDGTILYFQGTAQDVTARKMAEEAVRATNAQLMAVVRTAPVSVVVLDRDGLVQSWNPASERIFGWSETEVLGKPLPYVPEEKQTEHRLLRQRVLDGESFTGVEAGRRRKDGSSIYIDIYTAPLRDAEGNVTGILGINVDVTDHKNSEERLREQMLHMTALRRIDAAISETFELRAMLALVLDEIRRVLEVDAAAVSLLAPRSVSLEVASARGFHTREIESSPLLLSTEVGLKLMLEGRPFSTEDLRGASDIVPRQSLMDAEKFVFYSGMPLVTKGRIRGVLEVFHRSPKPRDETWVRLLDALSAQTAIAVENASMFQDLQRSNADLGLAYEATIEGWSRALDLRDKETEGHTLRVTAEALKLARSLGVRQDELGHLRRGALLHDIGKIGVPDRILLKPGPLTDEERAVMRRHPVVAYEMLSPIPYLHPALDIPYCHHEKWNGTGYPRGLRGEQIPLAARIFTVVDVWDALSSERPYRSAWQPDAVLKYIRDQRGEHFDPHVAEAFLRLLTDQ